jgi:hypothetical protein
MTEPVDFRAELDRAATQNEPPLTLDTDRLVAAGYARRRRRQVLRGVGVAVVAVAIIGLPTLVFAGPGLGVHQAQPASSGPSVEPTPGAPHGGCVGETRSGSTEAYAMAQYLQPRLPSRQHYHTDDGWQTAYRNNCFDGAKQDSNDVDFRVQEHTGDIVVTTARNRPAEPVARPCRPPDTGLASKLPPSPTATGGPTTGPTRSSGKPSHPTPTRTPSGPRFTRCETRTVAGGAKLTIEEQRDPTMNPSNVPFISRIVALWRTDGTVITVVADNRFVMEDQHPVAQPPLTIDEMIALVSDPGLQLHIPPAR